MNKTILIGAVAIIVIGLGVFLFQSFGSTTTQMTVNNPATLPVAVTSNGQFTIATTTPGSVASGSIQTTDFINDPAMVKDPINLGYYYLGYHMPEGIADPTATTNPPYIISYISATNYFNISLLQEPIGPVRIEAEQYLMTHLGITQNQMCRLDYMVSVPDRVNSQYSGINLGFSFCPGATVLPK